MKKKWTVFSLVILLVQYFSPLVVLADTISPPSNAITVTEVAVANQGSVDPSGIDFTVKGNVEANSSYQATMALTGVSSLDAPTGSVVNSSQQAIGTYQAAGQTLQLTINEGVSGPYEIKLKGQLADKETPQQSLGVTVNQQTKEQTVTLKAVETEATEPASSATSATEPSVPVSEAPETTEATKATDSSQTTESTTPPQKQLKADAERENQDITAFLGDRNFFTGLKVKGPNGENLAGQTVQLGDEIKLEFEWSLPKDVQDQMQVGDFYDYQLPPEIKISSKINFDLVNEAGEVYGVGTIGTDGKMHIVFNSKIEEESEISGTVNVTGKLQEGGLGGPGEGTIEFPFVDENESVPIIVKPDVENSIAKKGHPNRPTNPNEIIWDVDINLDLSTHTNAKVSETFPAGTKYKSVKVYKAKVDFEGNIIEGQLEEIKPPAYSVDADGNVTFPGEIKDAYRLEYTTSIIQEEKPGADGGTVEYVNSASLSSDELPDGIDAGASVTAKYHKALEKLAPSYDPTTQEFTWTIRYNYVEFNVPENEATVTDSFTSNMILKDDSVILNKVTFGDDGNPIPGEPLKEGTDYRLIPTSDGKGFTIEFIGDVDYAVDIHYVTQVDEEVTGNQIYKNDVENGSGNQSHNQGEAHQQGLIKGISDINYSTKTIEWHIKVNQNGYELNNWSMTDQMSPGLILALGTRSFSIIDSNLGTPLEEGRDYEIVYDQATGKIDVKFIGGYVKTNHKFDIHYKTKFDTAVLNEAGFDKFFNDASSKWTNQDGSDLTTGDHEEFEPRPEEGADGFKNGKYNAKTKTITWTLGINYNRQDLGKVMINDPITSNQKFVAGSLKAFRYTVGKDGAIVKGEQIEASEFELKFNYEEPSEANSNSLNITINKVGTNDQLLFEFDTSLVGEVINASKQYHNKATVDAEKVTGKFSIEGDVSIANGGSLIQKTGKQDKDGYLQWSATVNPSQSTVYNAKVTDTPSTNQVIDQSSVVVYETEVTEAGKLTKGQPLDPAKYTVSLTTDQVTGQQELVVVFTDEKIERAYILEYKAMLLLEKPSGETASNKIKLEGTNKENIEQEISKDVGVSASEGGGTAVGVTGKVVIRKVDNDGKVLTGAKFELWDKKNTQKLRDGEVSTEGILEFGKLPYGEYFLKETKAPAGHSIQDDLITGRKIKIDKNTSAAGNYLDIVNEINRVVLEKQTETGAKLAGATFKLEQQVAGKWEAVPGKDALVTNADGQLIVKGLSAGQYRFIETAAPTTPIEYLLDATPVEFEVVTNAQGQTAEVKVGPVINYLGSASFIKKDGDNAKLLAGAEFKITRIKDGSGKEINQAIGVTYKSDANGKVTMAGLAPGEYEVTEIKAPVGYLLNTKKITFKIAKNTVGKPTEVNAGEFLDYQGSVELTKTQEDGKFLAGAEFQIKDASGKEVGAVVTTDANGKLHVEGLAPGKYTLNEVKAPDGFIKNTEPMPFEIAAEAAGKPTVVVTKNFVNYKGSIKMLKVNTAGDRLPGAEFTLYLKSDLENQQPIKAYTSDDMGVIEIKDLAPGEYKLVETKAPQLTATTEYIKNDYPRFFTIEAEQKGKVETLNLGEYQNFKGKAVLSKASAEGNGHDLSGAIFELYQIVNGQEERIHSDWEIKTDEQGNMNLPDLGAGSYKLIEVKALEGHIINSNPIFITVEAVSPGDPTNEDPFSFENYQTTIQFKKTDTDGKLLTGATFNIFKANEKGEKVDETPVNPTPLTSATGEFEYKGLEVGFYVLEEVTAADGYIRNTDLILFELEAQTGKPEVVVLPDVINYQGAAELVKTDSNGVPLAGAIFTLYQGEEEIATATSDKDGLVRFEKLAPGKYLVKETSAPTDYILNTKPIEVTIAEAGAGEEAADAIELGDFKNYQGSVEFLKTDKAGTGLKGAVFGLYKEDGETPIKDPETEQAITATSDESGKVKFESLAPGKYVIKEIQAVEGFIQNTTPIAITIDGSANDQAINLTEANFINYKGSVSVIKKDQHDKVLAGAEFTIFDENGKAVQTQVTGEDGVATFTELAPNDNYLLKETKAPAGYVLNEAEMSFDVPAEFKGEPTIELLGEYVNFQGEAELVKVNEAGEKLFGAEFTLTNAAGEKTVVTSDKEGKVRFSDLAPGDYTVTETKAPDGYLIDTTPLTFTVDATFLPNGDNKVPAVINLGEVINYQGSAELTKTDEAGKALTGAEFTLKDEAGKETVVVSDEKGKVVFDQLAPGKYTVLETKAAAGYVLNTTPIAFTVEPSFKPEGTSKTPEVIQLGDFVNYKGAVELTKVDKADAKKVLAGAEFKIVDETNKTIKDQLTTGKDGKVAVDQLAPGTYYFVETKAPTGYTLSSGKTKFVIAAKNQGKPKAELVTVTNEKTPPTQVTPGKPGVPGKPTNPTKPGSGKLPQMNDVINNAYLIIGLSLIVFGSSIYRVRKKDSLR